jgi:hypothetical protein
MSPSFAENYGPQFAGGTFQVASQFIGQSLVDSIRKQFPRRRMERGDFYMDGVRNLLRTNLELIHPGDKPRIQIAYEASD